jgi:hypothetical protein
MSTEYSTGTPFITPFNLHFCTQVRNGYGAAFSDDSHSNPIYGASAFAHAGLLI